MMIKLTSASFAVLLCCALPGCAGDSERFPSLAVRDAERSSPNEDSRQAEEPASTDPAIISNITEIVAQASDKRAAFLTREAEVQILVQAAQDSLPGDAPFDRALAAIAQLRILRGETALSLAQLDQLERESATTFAPVGEIESAQMQVQQWLSAQDAALVAIGRSLVR